MTLNRQKLKYIFFTTLMFTITALICLILAEFVISRFYYSNITTVSDKQFDPVLGWTLKHGTYWIKASHKFKKHEVYINSFGLRNREVKQYKDKKKNRVIFLGDSFTYANAVSKDKLFTTLFEKNINRDQNKYDFEVINAGVPGYGTAQELLLMKRLAKYGIKGDIYVLVFFMNDILDNLRLSYGDLTENFIQPGFRLNTDKQLELEYKPRKDSESMTDNFVSVEKRSPRLKIIEVIRSRVITYLQTKPDAVELLTKLGFNPKLQRIPGLLNGWYREDIIERGTILTKALLKEINNTAKSYHAKLIIVTIPSPLQIYPDVYGKILKKAYPDNKLVTNFLSDIDKPQKVLKEICMELGMQHFDLYPVLVSNNTKELYLPNDGHFSDKGHNVVSKEITKIFIENFI